MVVAITQRRSSELWKRLLNLMFQILETPNSEVGDGGAGAGGGLCCAKVNKGIKARIKSSGFIEVYIILNLINLIYRFNETNQNI